MTKKYIIIQSLGYKTYPTIEQAKEHISTSGLMILEVSNEWSVAIKKNLIGGGSNE